MLASRAAVIHLHAFEKLNGSAQETSKKWFRVQVQRWPFVHIGRCKMEKQIPGLHNWAAIWMTFPFLFCVLTMAAQDLGGSTCCSANSFFCPIQHPAGFSTFSSDKNGWRHKENLKYLKNNLMRVHTKPWKFRKGLIITVFVLLCWEKAWISTSSVRSSQSPL